MTDAFQQDTTPDRPRDVATGGPTRATAGDGSGDRAVAEAGGWAEPAGTDLSPEQVERLQHVDEPVADANFGAELRGDLGNAEVADEADPANAPETTTPDTTLHHP